MASTGSTKPLSMESFVVSARKYRPVTFDTVVGQPSITLTLKNAIKNKQLAQAFLFTGPRGVGKTTCARILAKTINCFNLSDNIEACNVCESCQSFNRSHSFNIFELDAASNSSVDDIRNLVDQVRIPPQVGKYKVYIIDEVHMLSANAFNAFLKTLEEPPAYAKFILATTERHKIIPTILSRCQIFDFARISVNDIIRQLQFVAEKENIRAEEEALRIIARKADGAMRDALSIFDQLVSFTGNSVTYQQTIDNLNVLDYDYFFKMTDLVLQGDTPGILLLLEEIIQKGFECLDFLSGYGQHLRNLLVSKNPQTAQLMEEGDDVRQRYVKQGALCEGEFLLQALDINNRADVQYKYSSNKRLLLELTMLQTAEAVKKKVPESGIEDAYPLPAPPSQVVAGNRERPAAVDQSPEKGPPAPIQSEPVIPKPKEPETTTTPVGEKPAQPPRVNIPGLSIRIREEAEEEEPADDLLPEDLQDLDNEAEQNTDPLELARVWKEYAAGIREESQGLFLAMTTHPPEFLSDGSINLHLDNEIQQDIIRERRADILGFLRKRFRNYRIDIHSKVRENGHKTKAYLPKEKWEAMLEKNPEISRLKSLLDLDFEF